MLEKCAGGRDRRMISIVYCHWDGQSSSPALANIQNSRKLIYTKKIQLTFLIPLHCRTWNKKFLLKKTISRSESIAILLTTIYVELFTRWSAHSVACCGLGLDSKLDYTVGSRIYAEEYATNVMLKLGARTKGTWEVTRWRTRQRKAPSLSFSLSWKSLKLPFPTCKLNIREFSIA